LGYGRETYFWALIGACAAFVAGAAFSLRDGIDELIHPSATSSFAVAYVVLAISTVFSPASTSCPLAERTHAVRGSRPPSVRSWCFVG
jgi:divalent metal cation (Fe/Co/Zn/Cd) transporter